MALPGHIKVYRCGESKREMITPLVDAGFVITRALTQADVMVVSQDAFTDKMLQDIHEAVRRKIPRVRFVGGGLKDRILGAVHGWKPEGDGYVPDVKEE